MTRTSNLLIGVLGGFAVCLTAPGADPARPAANPYQGIVARNVFHLSPPPPPPPAPEAAQPPPPKILLVGITTLQGRRALIRTIPPAKPGEAPQEKSYLIGEGERQDDLAVQAVDEKSGTVKLNYAGAALTLNFKDNGVPGTGSAPVPVSTGAPVANSAQPQMAATPSFPALISPRLSAKPVPSVAAANGAGNERRPGYDEHGL
jgi:hypothetical protein